MLNQEIPPISSLKMKFSYLTKFQVFNLMFVITFLSNSFLVQAQGDDLIFEQIFLEQGLSQSIVKCILQDREGFMYFGTEDGLNRYDGYTFTVMRNNPEDLNSLSYNDINAMHLDFEGNIWIGTFNSGLNKYNPYTKKVTRFLHKTTDPNSISHDK
jgi:ligand-binding sensor domain-containing protein